MSTVITRKSLGVPFELYSEILKASESPDGEWILEGPISSEKKDFQGETVLTRAVRAGLDMWKKLGAKVDWNHLSALNHDASMIIGKGIEVFEGPCATGGTTPWIRATLHKGQEEAQKAWKYLQNGGSLFWSIGGRADREDGKVINTGITHIALTPYPVNSDAPASIAQLAKSLSCYENSPFTEYELLKSLDESQEIGGSETSGPTRSLWKQIQIESSPYYHIFKTLTAGSGPGLDSVGGRALVQEDVSGTVHCTDDADCECDNCKTKRQKSKYQLAA